jgi:hypothetical protein
MVRNVLMEKHWESFVSDIPLGRGKSLTFFYSVLYMFLRDLTTYMSPHICRRRRLW